jgi:hypothetical protein
MVPVPLVFQFIHFRGENAFSEFFSKTSVSLELTHYETDLEYLSILINFPSVI